MRDLEVILIPQLQDNYAYLLICRETNAAAIVDCPDAEPMIEQIEAEGVVPVAIFNTHHHWDHIGGNQDLIAHWPRMEIFGHHSDKERIPGMTNPLQEGDEVQVGKATGRVLFTPGHTSGHIAYVFEQTGDLFCGDTMFVAGCGRLFEGTATQMHESLQKLGGLDSATRVYCGHEYTASNLRFALSVDPDNQALQAKQKEVEKLRAEDNPTIPSTIGTEWQINPFLRVKEDALRMAAQKQGANPDDPAAVFGAIRSLKDNF